MNNTFLIDAHIHIYPEYDQGIALRTALTNLTNSFHGEGTLPIYAVCLTERNDCHFFKDICKSQRIDIDPSIKVEVVSGSAPAVRLYFETGEKLLIIPGRQIVSKERLEILAFTVDVDIPDRELSFSEIFKLIWDAGGIPVINWAPGKWLFKRGKIISGIVNDPKMRPLLLCDTTLRPILCPEPKLMRTSGSHGIKVIGGSDPLPFHGEEKRFGTYATLAVGPYDESDPVKSIRNLVLDPAVELKRVGKRSSLLTLVMRMFKYYRK